MIINFHPKELPSKKGLELISKLNKGGEHKVIHATDKTKDEWQTIISGGEKLVLVSPVYWWSAGYEFDKWAQNVLSYGFAYKYNDKGMPEGLLKGREFEMHMTHGTPNDYAKNMQDNIRTRFDKGIFGFCDSKVKIHFYDQTA